jgi:hypothetical protein
MIFERQMNVGTLQSNVMYDFTYFRISPLLFGAWGSVVVKALRYYSDVSGIDSRWCHWIFQWHIFFPPPHGPGFDSAPSGNEYQEHSWGWRRPVREGDDFPSFKCRMPWKCGSLNLLEPSGPHRVCYGTALPLPVLFTNSSNFMKDQTSTRLQGCW